MGKQTPRWVAAVLIVSVLVVLALQNLSPTLALVFLGVSSVPLPLGVWLVGAIALGALTTLAIASLTEDGSLGGRRPRRRWRMRPDPPTGGFSAPSDGGHQTWESPSPDSSPRSSQPFREPPTTGPASTTTGESAPRQSAPSSAGEARATEDWQAWGQRTPASQWEDWSQAPIASREASQATGGFPFFRRRPPEVRANEALQDLEQGWDTSAQKTVYVAPGGSDIEDALDDIATGWDDWDSEAPSPAETAYSQGYPPNSQVDAVYAPPDDTRAAAPERQPPRASDQDDWGLDDEETTVLDLDPDDRDDSSVYDADYRVIIPPHRSLEDEADADSEPDRPT